MVTAGTLTPGATLAEATCVPPTEGEQGGFAPLIPLIGIAVDAAVNLASDQLAKAKTGRTASWPATRGGIEFDAGHYCLALSRGVLKRAGTANADKLALGEAASFDGVPAFVMLADLEVKPATTGFNLTITPKFLSYAETSAPKRGSGKKDVAVLLAFDGAAPTAAAKANAEAGGGAAAAADATADPKKSTGGAQLQFGKLEIGKSYDAALLSPIVTQTTVNKAPAYTVSAVVTESEDPSVVLTTFAAAFDKNKDSLSTAIQTTVKNALGVKDPAK